jgi:hypothetical protein
MGRPVRRGAVRGALRALGVQGRLHAVFGQEHRFLAGLNIVGDLGEMIAQIGYGADTRH